MLRMAMSTHANVVCPSAVTSTDAALNAALSVAWAATPSSRGMGFANFARCTLVGCTPSRGRRQVLRPAARVPGSVPGSVHNKIAETHNSTPASASGGGGGGGAGPSPRPRFVKRSTSLARADNKHGSVCTFPPPRGLFAHGEQHESFSQRAHMGTASANASSWLRAALSSARSLCRSTGLNGTRG